MKLTMIAVAAVLALSSTAAFAQVGDSGAGAGTSVNRVARPPNASSGNADAQATTGDNTGGIGRSPNPNPAGAGTNPNADTTPEPPPPAFHSPGNTQ